jgi:hypothetical protein
MERIMAPPSCPLRGPLTASWSVRGSGGREAGSAALGRPCRAVRSTWCRYRWQWIDNR